MEPLISVVIPVHNEEKYIKKCIESIQKNTYQNLEIICVDDGSVDESLIIIKSIADDDARIKVINQKWGGLSKARNTGMACAHGTYIAFVDADDWIHKDYFKWLLEGIQKCDFAVCSYELVVDGNDEETRVDEIDSIEYLSVKKALKNRTIFTFAHGRLYRKELIEDIWFSENVFRSEDILFNHLVIPKCNQIAYIDCPLYYRRIREGSLIKTSNAELGLSVQVELLKMVVEELPPYNIILRRAYRSLLSYRYKYGIKGGSQYYYKETDKIALQLRYFSHRLPVCERIGYLFLIQHPRLFGLIYQVRQKWKH